jgi:CheY-like chemotaxis protein
VASLILTKIGYQVDVVGNGLEALDAVAQRDYVAILMDVQMPEMDGLEATRRIRAADSPARNPQMPIIALTAHAMEEDRRISLEAGMNDHVAKPIDSKAITELLQRYAPIGEPVLTS